METRYQRIVREQAERQAKREQQQRKPKRARKPRPLWSETYKKTADHVDGYDRDDLGESPDF